MLRIEEKSRIPFQASLIDQAEALVDRRLRAEVRAIEGAHEAVAARRPATAASARTRAPSGSSSCCRRPACCRISQGRIFSALDTPTGKPKPAPDVFLHAARTLGADPANTFVIEDSVHGIAGAKAAGMRVIGFTGAAHSYPGHADALTEAGAETVIRRWADFAAVVAALSDWSADLKQYRLVALQLELARRAMLQNASASAGPSWAGPRRSRRRPATVPGAGVGHVTSGSLNRNCVAPDALPTATGCL